VTGGGTNFPAGRTTWYTTDYGWDGLRTVVDKMAVITRAKADYLLLFETRLYSAQDDTNINTSWESAKAACTNVDVSFVRNGYGSWGQAQGYWDGTKMAVKWLAQKHRKVYAARDIATATSNTLPVAFIVRTKWLQGVDALGQIDESIYDSSVLGYTVGGAWNTNGITFARPFGWNVETNVIQTTSNTYLHCRATLGVTNYADMAWCDDPAPFMESDVDYATTERGAGIWYTPGGAGDYSYVVLHNWAAAFKFRP
jgi:hypothetical protein